MSFKTLPHRNLLVTAVFSLSAFLIALYFNIDHRSYSGVVGGQTAQVLPVVESEPMDIDSDADGLTDWKERLYGSNIHEVDSDGDGTNDGDEVRLGRNPALANTAPRESGATDRLAYLENKNHATSTTDMAGLKKEFFEKYLAEGSRDIRETTFRDLIKKVDTKKFTVIKHEALGLSIVSDNSTEGVKTFVNAFGIIMKKYSVNPLGRSEDDIIQDAIAKKDPSTRSDLQIIAITYKNFAHDLLQLKVPSTLAKAQLLIVNGYQGMGEGLLALGNIKEKPLDGAAGYQSYLKSRLDVTKGYALIVSYVGKGNIAFDATEPGYPFSHRIGMSKSQTTR